MAKKVATGKQQVCPKCGVSYPVEKPHKCKKSRKKAQK